MNLKKEQDNPTSNSLLGLALENLVVCSTVWYDSHCVRSFSLFPTLKCWYIYLIIYFDDIILTASDQHGMSQIKYTFVTTFKPKILAKSDIS